MPVYFATLSWFWSLWPLLVLPTIVALLLAIPRGQLDETSLSRGKNVWARWIVLLGFAVLGAITGFLTGMSRSPAVGTVLPAVLSLVGGIAVFMLSKDGKVRDFVSRSVVALSVCIIVAALWGALERSAWEDYVSFRKTNIEELKRQAVVEAAIRDYRRKLGLPIDDAASTK